MHEFQKVIIITGIGSIGIILCLFQNKNRDIELFYKTYDPVKYYLFMISYAIVSLAFFINIQYICKAMFLKVREHIKSTPEIF